MKERVKEMSRQKNFKYIFVWFYQINNSLNRANINLLISDLDSLTSCIYFIFIIIIKLNIYLQKSGL